VHKSDLITVGEGEVRRPYMTNYHNNDNPLRDNNNIYKHRIIVPRGGGGDDTHEEQTRARRFISRRTHTI